MKIIKDLLDSVDKEILEKELFNLFKDEKNNIIGSLEVLEKLKNMTPIFTNNKKEIMTVILKKLTNGEEEWLGVFGHIFKTKETYALSLTPWKEWLGYNISKKMINKYGKEKYLAYILYEMTYHGFDECDAENKLLEIFGKY